MSARRPRRYADEPKSPRRPLSEISIRASMVRVPGSTAATFVVQDVYRHLPAHTRDRFARNVVDDPVRALLEARHLVPGLDDRIADALADLRDRLNGR